MRNAATAFWNAAACGVPVGTVRSRLHEARRRMTDHLLGASPVNVAGARGREAVELLAGSRVTILECDLLNPPWDPDHCPPGVLWLIRTGGGRINGVRLYHPAPGR